MFLSLFFFFLTLDYATRASPRWWCGGIDHGGVPSRGGDVFKALGSARQTPIRIERFDFWGEKRENWEEFLAKL